MVELVRPREGNVTRPFGCCNNRECVMFMGIIWVLGGVSGVLVITIVSSGQNNSSVAFATLGALACLVGVFFGLCGFFGGMNYNQKLTRVFLWWTNSFGLIYFITCVALFSLFWSNWVDRVCHHPSWQMCDIRLYFFGISGFIFSLWISCAAGFTIHSYLEQLIDTFPEPTLLPAPLQAEMTEKPENPTQKPANTPQNTLAGEKNPTTFSSSTDTQNQQDLARKNSENLKESKKSTFLSPSPHEGGGQVEISIEKSANSALGMGFESSRNLLIDPTSRVEMEGEV